MKKIFTSICLIALVGFFVCSTASADETFCGTAIVQAIRLLPSDQKLMYPLVHVLLRSSLLPKITRLR